MSAAQDCVYFYSHTRSEYACFSQFYAANFKDDAGCAYTCAEQYMMAGKARAMGDENTLTKILQCGHEPRQIKALGRAVKPFDEERWSTKRESVVAHGNFLKFSQNEDLRAVLLHTKGSTLAEAAPYDAIWGIGLKLRDAEAGKKWCGLNLLGKCLMQTRDAIKSGQAIPAPVFNDFCSPNPTKSGSAYVVEEYKA